MNPVVITAVAAFIVASVLDARSSNIKGAYEFWPLYRWPPWKKGPFQLWMYVAVSAAVVVIGGLWQQRWVELFILAGIRFVTGLWWNPRQAAKLRKA